MNYMIIMVVLSSTSLCADWSSLFEQYKSVMTKDTYTLLCNQYTEYCAGNSPAIAHPIIKEIPITECNEPCISIRNVHPRIKVMEGEELLKVYSRLEDMDPRSEQHDKVRQSVFHKFVTMIDILDRLAPEFGYEVGSLEIRLFEGLRDIATQKQIFDMVYQSICTKNPTWSHEEVYAETSKWVSPYINNVPVHSTGAAIDIHLWNNATQSVCDMGPFNTGGAKAPTFSNDPDLSELQLKNRLLLLLAATESGLTNYVYEFWHFSYGDRYASYWREADREKRYALYNRL